MLLTGYLMAASKKCLRRCDQQRACNTPSFLTNTDRSRFEEYGNNGTLFVTRKRKNVSVEVLEERVVEPGSNGIRDALVIVDTKENAMKSSMRLVVALDTEGREISILSNL